MLPESVRDLFTLDTLGDFHAEIFGPVSAGRIASDLTSSGVSFMLKIIKRRKKPVSYRFIVLSRWIANGA